MVLRRWVSSGLPLVVLWIGSGFGSMGVTAPAAGPAVAASASPADEVDHAIDMEAHGSTNPLTIDPDLAVFTAVLFLILVAVMSKFAWRPILSALEQREGGIARQVEGAQDLNNQANRLLADHQARMAEAAAEVRTLLDQNRRDAEAQKQQIVSAAEEAARKERDHAVSEIRGAKGSVLEDLTRSSVDAAFELAGRIVRRPVSRDGHAEMVREFSGEDSRSGPV